MTAPFPFAVETASSDGLWVFEVTGGEATRSYRLADNGPSSYLDFFDALARDFGCRQPLSRRPYKAPPGDAPLRPLLTGPVSPLILYGYGDPCVIRAPDPKTGAPAWWLLVTSNDAPDAFPVLRSEDLVDWRLETFVFPAGEAPPWALTGPNKGDFWAPEMHRVGEEYWICFTARQRDRELAIGIARAPSPAGPFTADPEPLLAGGVIDAHILVDPHSGPLLFWKEDSNGIWPRLLAELLTALPALGPELFEAEADRRTVALTAALWPWAQDLEPMEQFSVLQPLIEAVTDDFTAFEARLKSVRLAPSGQGWEAEIAEILRTLKTRVYAQPLSPDGAGLTGERTLIVENDQTWEAHLIEGVWVHERQGLYHLFYSGNDFSTHHYGIGAAVAKDPLGPYAKTQPLLRSTRQWSGPGHPSVAPGPDGEPVLFLHAFFPGKVGYKAFRALLCAELRFGPDGPSLT